LAALTPAGITVTAAVCVTSTPPTVAEIVFPSALVELNVDVETPLELVFAAAEKLLLLPVDDMATVAFWIRLPNWSLAVMVTRDALPAPVVQDEEQAESVACGVVTVDCAAETAAAFTVTVAIWVILVLFAGAESVFASATVELSGHVATPPTLAVCVRLTGDVVLPPPDTESVTLALGTGLPEPSRAVTVISVAVLVPVEHPLLHAVIVVGAATTVDWLAETPPAVMLTTELVSDVNPAEVAGRA